MSGLFFWVSPIGTGQTVSLSGDGGLTHLRPMTKQRKTLESRPGSLKGTMVSKLADHVDAALELYAHGHSFQQIVEQLKLPVTSMQLRTHLREVHVAAYEQALVHRAHEMIERNAEDAARASANGDSSGLKTAIETRFKLAAMYAPEEYGERKRIELTGADGGPMKVEGMSDEALAKIAAGASA